MDYTGWERPNKAHDDEASSWIDQLAGDTDDFIRSYQKLTLGSTTADPDSGAIGRTSMGGSLGSTTADPDSGAIGRTSMGGSMRMPRRPSLGGDQISTARYSRDTSYEASEGAVIAAKPKKGLKSRIKNAFGWSSCKKSSKDSTHQPDFVQTTYRVDYAKRGRPDDSPDEVMFAEFKEAMDAAREADPARARSVATVQKVISALRGFVKWLQEPPRHLSLAQLIDKYNLDDLVTSYVGPDSSKNLNNVKNAVALLRDSRAGNVRKRSRVTGDLYLEDQDLIDGYLAYVGGAAPTSAQTVMKNSQRRFGAWLRANQKPSIESRLNSGQQRFAELKKDLKKFREAVKQSPGSGLERLQKYQQVLKANEAWRTQPAKEAGWPQQPGQSPVSSYDQDPLWDEVSTPYELRDNARSAPAWDDEPSSATAQSSHIYSGLEPLVNLPYTPYELRDDARSATAQSSHIYSGLESLVDLPSTPYDERDDARSAPAWDDWNPANIPDFGSVVGRWQHGLQPAPDYLSRALMEHGLMPAWNSQTRFLIHRELYTAELRRDGGVFLTQQFGAWLGDRDWLYDPHIERDFDRLRGELQRNHPDLAARTTLVIPAVVQLLQRDPLRAFQYMVRGQPGTAQEGAEDAADFVFIPVTDAQGDDRNQRGTHWSLLLLDRRNRNSPIAYHYDSAGDYNAAAAERVARGVGARVIRMGMAQQQNNYDCGVFLLEAARTLIGQLTRGQPPRDLDNLVADRRVLQARLRS